MRLIVVLLLFLFYTFSTLSAAQVKGKIYDINTKLPLKNIEVFFLNIPNNRTFSNELGLYELNNLSEGEYVLTAASVNYDSCYLNINISKDTTLVYDFYLKTHIYKTDEVLVTAISEHNSVMDVGVSEKIIRQIPPFIEADVIRAVQILPGVAATSDYSSQLFIRGSDSYPENHDFTFCLMNKGFFIGIKINMDNDNYSFNNEYNRKWSFFFNPHFCDKI